MSYECWGPSHKATRVVLEGLTAKAWSRDSDLGTATPVLWVAQNVYKIIIATNPYTYMNAAPNADEKVAVGSFTPRSVPATFAV